MIYKKKVEWVCPKGTHQARIDDAGLVTKIVGGRKEEMIRFIMPVTSLVHPLKTYTARLLYKPNEVDKFVADFIPVIGEEHVARLFNMSGELISDSLIDLEGLKVDIETDLYHGAGHANPLTLVTQICPLGCLTTDFGDEPKAA